jgi:hypothetical protein
MHVPCDECTSAQHPGDDCRPAVGSGGAAQHPAEKLKESGPADSEHNDLENRVGRRLCRELVEGEDICENEK